MHNIKRQKDFLNAQYRGAAKLLVTVTWGLLVVCAALAPWYNTWLEFFVIGLPAAIMPTVLYYLQPVARITRVSVGLAYMILSALMIHQGHGMIELHFGIFVLLAFLLYFRDWLPIVSAAALIAVHHLSFNLLQEADYGVFIFSSTSGLEIVIIHAVFVVAETAVLVYMAVILQRESVETASTKTIAQYLVAQDGKISLQFDEDTVKSNFGENFGPYFMTLKNSVSGVQLGANALASSSQKVAEGNQGLAQKTEAQSQALASISASVQQISQAVSLNAEFANKAEDLAAQASSKAVSGVDVVGKAVTAMTDISESSSSLGVFLDTIEEIAFQTNLLALNASIEAAHAGEQGRGFAVVANEVRALAQRSSEASKQSRELIETSLAKINNGSDLVNHAGSSLSEIFESFEEMSGLVSKIAVEGRKQQQGIQTVNESVENINELNRTNVALVNQVASTSVSMKAEASGLIEQVACFDLGSGR